MCASSRRADFVHPCTQIMLHSLWTGHRRWAGLLLIRAKRGLLAPARALSLPTAPVPSSTYADPLQVPLARRVTVSSSQLACCCGHHRYAVVGIHEMPVCHAADRSDGLQLHQPRAVYGPAAWMRCLWCSRRVGWAACASFQQRLTSSVQSVGRSRDRRSFLLARGRFACGPSYSPEGGQTCFGELLTRTFRKGMGLGGEEQAVARERKLQFSVQSDVING
jgi:hypothetical protein